MGVRNKYCSVWHETTGNTVPTHDCFLNWDQSLSAMETLTSLWLDFFNLKSSMVSATHISGDSSVYPAGFHMATFLNVPTTSFWTTMENLVHDKPSYKGRGKLTESMRNKLTKAACCVISVWLIEYKLSKNSSKTCWTILWTALVVIQTAIQTSAKLCNNSRHNHNKWYIRGATTEEETTHETNSDITSGAKIIFCKSVSYLDLNDVFTTQVQAWVDATDNEGLDDIRSTPTEVDQHMICNIQQAIS